MSVRFQADRDLHQGIVTGAIRREPALDFQTARAARLDGLEDLEVLRRAAQERRILVTHDKRSMARHLARFLAEGNVSPGVLVVIPQHADIGRVIDTLILIWAASEPEEWRSRITKIPF